MTDAEREELRARIRRMNRDSSGDRSGKRGPLGGPLGGLLVCLAVLLTWLFPGTGRRRRCGASASARPEQQATEVAMPPHRSPYSEQGACDAPLVVDGALVRPYFRAHERERRARHREARRQAERRVALEFALGGVDVGPTVIHGVRVPRDWRVLVV